MCSLPHLQACKPIGYLSDHIPLLLSIPTSNLGIHIPRITNLQPPIEPPCQILARPVSSSDQQALTQSVLDPLHRVIQELEEVLHMLNPAYAEATTFRDNLKSKSAKDTKKLISLCQRRAAEVVEGLANNVANLIHSSHHVALKI
eukprot:793271-Pelagomonas_calceolata.AAC.1